MGDATPCPGDPDSEAPANRRGDAPRPTWYFCPHWQRFLIQDARECLLCEPAREPPAALPGVRLRSGTSVPLRTIFPILDATGSPYSRVTSSSAPTIPDEGLAAAVQTPPPLPREAPPAPLEARVLPDSSGNSPPDHPASATPGTSAPEPTPTQRVQHHPRGADRLGESDPLQDSPAAPATHSGEEELACFRHQNSP